MKLGNFSLPLATFGRPQVDLLAVLPLQHQAGDRAGADLERVRVGGVPAFELDPADRADVVGLFQRLDQLVGIGRAGSLDRVGDVIDLVVSGVAAIGREIAVAFLEGGDEWQRLRRHGDIGSGEGLVQHAFDRAVGVVPEAGIARLRGNAEHRDRHLLLFPLHCRLHADMGNAGDDHIGLFALDLIEDRREIRRIGGDADVVEDLEPDIRQAFQVFGIERRGPGRIFAHDDGRLHLQLADEQILGRCTYGIGNAGRGRIAVERIFEMLVILGDILGDDVGGGARRHHHRLQASGPRLERQHDLADVAGDDGIDVILVHRPLEGANQFRGGRVIVVGENLNLAAVETAGGVDLVGGKLGGERDRRAGDSLRFGDDADLDRPGGLRGDA